MLGRALKEVKLPFPDDFFPELVVTPEDDDLYRRKAQTKVQETLRSEFPATRFHPAQRTDQWKLIGDRQGVQLYRERGIAQGNAVQVVCVGSLTGSMEDVMWGLYAASTPAFKTQRSIMHSDYLDANLLAVLDEEDCDEEDTAFSYRFSGIKWVANAPTGKLTMHKRDMCWHETMGLAVDANGQEVGYLTIQSVRINECPPFEQFGVVRSTANVCYIFRRLANGQVGVYMKGEHSVGGKSRSWGSDPVIADMWLAIVNVLECAHSKRLTRMLRGKDLFSATQSKTCDICDQKVRGLRSAENCKICGKNVCDKCRISKPIYPSKNTTSFPCLMQFCKRCLSDVKDRTYVRSTLVSHHSDNASSQGSGSSTFRQSLTSTAQSGMYTNSVYSTQSAPVRGPPSMGGARYHGYQQHYSEGTIRTSPTASIRSGRSFGSSDQGSFSDTQPPMAPLRQRQGPVRGPVSQPTDHGQAFRQKRDSNARQYQRHASGSVDSTHEMDVMETSFRGRLRLNSDHSSISEYSDAAPVVELPSSRIRAHTGSAKLYQKGYVDVDVSDNDDVHDVIELQSRMAPPPPPEPVDVFHQDKLKYINSFSADSSGNLANPTLSSGRPASASNARRVKSEQELLMERLLQANMTAEATYLLAKYSNNLAKDV